MGNNAELRRLLEKKLGVKQAQLYNIAKVIADSLSISTADAILVLAAKNHINLHKHGGSLPAGKLDQIRGLLPYLPATAQSPATAVVSSGNGKRTVRYKKGFKVKLQKPEDDPILAKATRDEMEAMVPVYKTLYQLENSIRQFIARVLRAKQGENWWDKLAPRGLKDHLAKRTTDDEINAWHKKRSANPIDYLDLNQLPALVRATQTDFVLAFFPTYEWFQQFIEEVYRSRCVVCHMNPLIQPNVDAVAVRFNQWELLVKGKAADVENLEKIASAEAPPVHRGIAS